MFYFGHLVHLAFLVFGTFGICHFWNLVFWHLAFLTIGTFSMWYFWHLVLLAIGTRHLVLGMYYFGIWHLVLLASFVFDTLGNSHFWRMAVLAFGIFGIWHTSVLTFMCLFFCTCQYLIRFGIFWSQMFVKCLIWCHMLIIWWKIWVKSARKIGTTKFRFFV